MTDTTWAGPRDRVRNTARRRGRPPASDSALTRERILQAALRVFAESGYEAATFQAIAVEIGLTRPAINNYFPSKSALYGQVVDRTSTAVREAIEAASAAPTLAEQVLEFLRLTVHGEDADRALAGFLVQSAMEAQHLPTSGDQGEAALLIETFIRERVDAAGERRELLPGIDADEVTDALMGVVWGTAFQVSRGLHRDTTRAERMLGQVGALLDHGLRRAG